MKNKRLLAIFLSIAFLTESMLSGWNSIRVEGKVARTIGAETDIDASGIYDGYSYDMMTDGTISLTGYTGKETVVEVPSEIKGHKVVSISNCFNYNDSIQEITIPDTIHYIGFVGYGCSKLRKLTINAYNPGDDITANFTYQDGMFGNCQNLNTIIVNENSSLKTFWAKDNVLYFGEAKDLTLVLYPAGKMNETYTFTSDMKIGGSAFVENKYIKNVIFEGEIMDTIMFDGTIIASSNVFYHCTNLESVILKKGAPTILAGWFDGCVSLKTFSIPSTVSKIGSMTFNGCVSLKEITIPQSVVYIENTAFQDCIELEKCIIKNDEITFETVLIDGKEQSGIWNGCNKVTIYCNSGSNAEKYAKKFGLSYDKIGDNKNSITVKFYANGGKVKITSKKVQVGKKYGELPVPTRKKYTFVGWYTKKVGGKKVVAKTINNSSKDMSLYACWKKVTVKKTTISAQKTNKKKVILIKWNKVSDAQGYRIIYATDKKLKKGKKYVWAKKKAVSKKIKKLKEGKVYYIKVQAYKLDSTGKKVWGKGKKIKVTI